MIGIPHKLTRQLTQPINAGATLEMNTTTAAIALPSNAAIALYNASVAAVCAAAAGSGKLQVLEAALYVNFYSDQDGANWIDWLGISGQIVPTQPWVIWGILNGLNVGISQGREPILHVHPNFNTQAGSAHSIDIGASLTIKNTDVAARSVTITVGAVYTTEQF